MKLVASVKGQYKGVMLYPGDVFEFDENDKENPRAPWMLIPRVNPPMPKVFGSIFKSTAPKGE